MTSKLAKLRHSNFYTPHPPEYARAAVRAIGFERALSPHWAHYVIVELGNKLPLALQELGLAAWHLGIRKKAYAKKERLAKDQ